VSMSAPLQPKESVVWLHGQVLSTPFEITAPPAQSRPTVRLLADLRPWSEIESSGTPVAESHDELGAATMRVFEEDHGATIEFPEFLRATVDSSGCSAVSLSARSQVAADLIPVLTSPIVGALAMLRGALVLHASAVVVDDMAILLLAPRGGGKSSVAALLCSAGATLLSEDVCAVERGSAGFVVHGGQRELRLRNTTPGLLRLPNLVPGGSHADQRQAVYPAAEMRDEVIIRRVVLIELSIDAEITTVVPLQPLAAVSVLLSSQRCATIRPRPRVRHVFDMVSELATSAAVSVVTIPWAEHRRTFELGQEVLESLR
jgi:hypothetical protein